MKTVVVSGLLSICSLCFSSEKLELSGVIDKIDRLYRSKTAAMALEMQVNTPHWKRTMKMQVWTEGLKKTFITILSPLKDKGVSTLRNDKEMWNFFPKINKVMKVPPSMMMGSWMGSDFTNDDLVKESSFREDYNARRLENEVDETGYYIEFTPKKQTVSVWGKVVVEVDTKTVLPKTQKYYDEKGKLIRTLYFKDVRKLGGRLIPAVMELIPHNKSGYSTRLIHREAEFDAVLDPGIFTLRNLKKVRR